MYTRREKRGRTKKEEVKETSGKIARRRKNNRKTERVKKKREKTKV